MKKIHLIIFPVVLALAIILDINVVLNNNTNEIQVSIQFQVVTTEEIVKLELSLARLR